LLHRRQKHSWGEEEGGLRNTSAKAGITCKTSTDAKRMAASGERQLAAHQTRGSAGFSQRVSLGTVCVAGRFDSKRPDCGNPLLRPVARPPSKFRTSGGGSLLFYLVDRQRGLLCRSRQWPRRVPPAPHPDELGPHRAMANATLNPHIVAMQDMERSSGSVSERQKQIETAISEALQREAARHDAAIKNMHRLRALRLERDQKAKRK
jgi:hypothetical protein